MRFGIMDENERKVFLPGLEQQLSVSTGVQWNYSDCGDLNTVRNDQNIDPYNTVVMQ